MSLSHARCTRAVPVPSSQHGSRCPHPHSPLAALNRIRGEARLWPPPFAPPGAGHGLAAWATLEDSPGIAAGAAPGMAQGAPAPRTGKGGTPAPQPGRDIPARPRRYHRREGPYHLLSWRGTDTRGRRGVNCKRERGNPALRPGHLHLF